MPIEKVTGITSLLVLPWALKFLWAPMIDALRFRWWGLRCWILLAQTLMALPLLALLRVDVGQQVGLVTALLLAHAVCAATQDVAIDGLAIRTTPPEERGSINAWMQAGMLTARGIFGGASLWAERYIGPGMVILALVAAVWASGVLLVLLRDSAVATDERGPHPGGHLAEVRGAIARALRDRNTYLGLGFALIAGAGFEAVGAVAGPMLRERGHPSELVGMFYAVPVIGATIVGGFLGGRLADRYGRLRAAGLSVAVTALAVGALACVVWRVPGGERTGLATPEVAALSAVYVMVGALTASSYALFMELTDPAIGATQFSAFMGATNLCESWSARVGGRVAGAAGYPASWALTASVSLLALALLSLMHRVRAARGGEVGDPGRS